MSITSRPLAKDLKTLMKLLFLLRNWWVFYLDYFKFFKTNKIYYHLRDGYTFKAIPGEGDGLVINEIWGEHTYTPKGFEIKNNDIVVDIGGHKGYFTTYASKHAAGGKVFSFEPMTKNFDLLTWNAERNKRKNITPFKLGVASSKGKKKLFVNGNNLCGGTLFKERFAHMNGTNSFVINCITLKDVFSQCKISKIDFLKIDCEGAEYEILRSTPKAIFEKIEKISMEYHQMKNQRVSILENILRDNGYKSIQVVPQGETIGMLYAKK